jgi:hypothetical protein
MMKQKEWLQKRRKTLLLQFAEGADGAESAEGAECSVLEMTV